MGLWDKDTKNSAQIKICSPCVVGASHYPLLSVWHGKKLDRPTQPVWPKLRNVLRAFEKQRRPQHYRSPTIPNSAFYTRAPFSLCCLKFAFRWSSESMTKLWCDSMTPLWNILLHVILGVFTSVIVLPNVHGVKVNMGDQLLKEMSICITSFQYPGKLESQCLFSYWLEGEHIDHLFCSFVSPSCQNHFPLTHFSKINHRKHILTTLTQQNASFIESL